jgi:hypothetical protein
MLWRVRACAGQRPAEYARCVVSGCGDRSVRQCRLAVAAAARLGLGVVLVVAVALVGWVRGVGPGAAPSPSEPSLGAQSVLGPLSRVGHVLHPMKD